MDYFSKPFSICLLRNHILKDPIIDWLNVNESLNKKYTRDTNTFYKDFILKEWEEYKFNFLKILQQKADTNVPINTSIEQTQRMIKEKYPLILGAHLLYKDMIVYCDIASILTFLLLFPKIKNYLSI